MLLPALCAVVRVPSHAFAPLDFADICVPGGVRCHGFVDAYGEFTAFNEMGTPLKTVPLDPFSSYFVHSIANGTAPVVGHGTKGD